MAITVRLLGDLAVSRDGSAVPVVGRRPRTLLAVLALAGGQPVPATALYERIWGAAVSGDQRANLYSCVRRLRQQLGTDAVAGGGGSYWLQVAPEHVDALRFTRLLAQARAAGAERPRLLLEALRLYRGRPFGEEKLSDWVAGERRRLADRWLQAYDDLQRLSDGKDPAPELHRVVAELRDDRPNAPSRQPVEAVPRQLPMDAPVFVGRRGALSDLDRLLDADGGRVGVIHGMGGVGKTSLALHWAHRVADRFPDGQLFVDLHGYDSAEYVEPLAALDHLLHGLGIPSSQIPAELQARTALLRSTIGDGRMLIVLDNARDAEQVRPLLPGQGCVVLVTSRSRLRGLVAREGAAPVEVEPMSQDEAIEVLRSRLDSRQVAGEALPELADLCGYLPLTLGLAAERANARPDIGIAELIAELRELGARFDALADPDDSLADARAVFSWSYEALADGDARMFRLLGLCPTAEFGLAVAAALTGDARAAARRTLERLTNASLVVRVGADRYRVHDLLREYSRELLQVAESETEREAAFDRLADWCLSTLTAAREFLSPVTRVLHPYDPTVGDRFDSEQEALAWTRRFGDLLMAVAHRAADRRPWVTVGVAHLLWTQWTPREDMLGLQERALQAADRLDDPRARLAILNNIASCHMLVGDLAAAEQTFGAALEIARDMQDTVGEQSVLKNLGVLLHWTGRTREAVGVQRRALELSVALGYTRGEAMGCNSLANTLLGLGQLGEAAELARRAVELHRENDSHAELAPALDTLGQVLTAQGHHHAAVICFSEALGIVEQLDFPGPHAIVLGNLARALLADGQSSAGRDAARSALQLFDERGLTDTAELTRADLVGLVEREPVDSD